MNKNILKITTILCSLSAPWIATASSSSPQTPETFSLFRDIKNYIKDAIGSRTTKEIVSSDGGGPSLKVTDDKGSLTIGTTSSTSGDSSGSTTEVNTATIDVSNEDGDYVGSKELTRTKTTTEHDQSHTDITGTTYNADGTIRNSSHVDYIYYDPDTEAIQTVDSDINDPRANQRIYKRDIINSRTKEIVDNEEGDPSLKATGDKGSLTINHTYDNEGSSSGTTETDTITVGIANEDDEYLGSNEFTKTTHTNNNDVSHTDITKTTYDSSGNTASYSYAEDVYYDDDSGQVKASEYGINNNRKADKRIDKRNRINSRN